MNRIRQTLETDVRSVEVADIQRTWSPDAALEALRTNHGKTWNQLATDYINQLRRENCTENDKNA